MIVTIGGDAAADRADRGVTRAQTASTTSAGSDSGAGNEAGTIRACLCSATNVQVRLWTDAGRLRLEVHDNGRGIAPATVHDSTSLGLLGMKERVFSFGGSVEIYGAPERGTTVDVSIPLSG